VGGVLWWGVGCGGGGPPRPRAPPAGGGGGGGGGGVLGLPQRRVCLPASQVVHPVPPGFPEIRVSGGLACAGAGEGRPGVGLCVEI
jgi:hypothetical protein